MNYNTTYPPPASTTVSLDTDLDPKNPRPTTNRICFIFFPLLAPAPCIKVSKAGGLEIRFAGRISLRVSPFVFVYMHRNS